MKKKLLIASLALTIPVLAETKAKTETKVLAFAGSTRADSYNKKLIKEAAEILSQMGTTVTVIDLIDYPMPFYDADLEAKQGMPKHAKSFRDLLINSDAIIISSPEYNSSLSAVLKNAIDWASRSEEGQYSQEAFKGKKFAIMSAAPGKGGGGRGLVHLRSIIEAVGGEVIEPQVKVANAANAFGKNGKLENPLLKQELTQEVQALLTAKSLSLK